MKINEVNKLGWGEEDNNQWSAEIRYYDVTQVKPLKKLWELLSFNVTKKNHENDICYAIFCKSSEQRYRAYGITTIKQNES
jgi:hypothetical protein